MNFIGVETDDNLFDNSQNAHEVSRLKVIIVLTIDFL